MKSAITAARAHSYPPRWMARAKDMEVTDLPRGEWRRVMFRVVVGVVMSIGDDDDDCCCCL